MIEQGAGAYGRPADGSPVRTALTFATNRKDGCYVLRDGQQRDLHYM